MEDADAVDVVTYGSDIPEEYQSEVLKDILAARSEEE